MTFMNRFLKKKFIEFLTMHLIIHGKINTFFKVKPYFSKSSCENMSLFMKTCVSVNNAKILFFKEAFDSKLGLLLNLKYSFI